MKKLLFPLTIILAFYLSSLAYDKVEASQTAKLEAEVATLKAQVGTLNHAVAAKDIQVANKEEEQKKLLKFLFPNNIDQIDKVFAPPGPAAPAPAHAATPEKAPEAPKGDK